MPGPGTGCLALTHSQTHTHTHTTGVRDPVIVTGMSQCVKTFTAGIARTHAADFNIIKKTITVINVMLSCNGIVTLYLFCK